MAEDVDDFLRSLKVTAGSRFNAAKRLENIDRRMTLLSSFTSAYIILLSVGPSLIGVGPEVQPTVNMFSTALAVLLLASTVLSYASNHAVLAELHHRSALEIQEIRRRLRFTECQGPNEQIRALSDEYSRILAKYSINHIDADFYRYQISNPEIYQLGWIEWLFKMAVIFLSRTYPAMILVAVTLAVIFFAVNMLTIRFDI